MRAWVFLLLVSMSTPALAAGRLEEAVPYTEGASLDLYLPARANAPLLVFVHSRFWSDGEKGASLARQFARPLQRAGAAVAIVRHRAIAEHPHPAQAEDVAAAIGFLHGRSGAYGYDPSRLYLAGHGSGGHLAALVATDPRHLEGQGLAPDAISGVAVFSGSFDLAGDHAVETLEPLYEQAFGGASARRDASPVRHARGDAPTFLLLVAQRDLPGALGDADHFARTLRQAGHPRAEHFVVPGRDHWTALDVSSPDGAAAQHLLALMELPGARSSIADSFGTRSYWRDPGFTTLPFWREEAQITRYEVDERFLFTLNMPFARPGRPRLLNPAHYSALDLMGYIARNVPGGDGGWTWLTVTNARGEKVVWHRDEIEALAPRLVVGLDDRRQLFEITDVYHTKRRYTWKEPDEDVWVMARPLGAFIHFSEPAPPSVDPQIFGRFALEEDAFEVSQDDPLAPLRDLPEREREMVTETFRCVSCHSFRGVGARSGHIRARDGQRVGGFALSLEEYPAGVWRRYCFEQVDLAAEIGATPVALGADAQALFELVERERRR